VWTPRRIGLVLLGLTLATVAYVGYSVALGTIDGLPILPDSYLVPASGQQNIENVKSSRTDRKLAEAFGQNSLEMTDNSTYKNKFDTKDGQSVLAIGPPSLDGSLIVTVSPVSFAQFGQPITNSKPGVVREISTFHADKARLRFDRPISSIQDIEKAKLLEIELISDADLPTSDPRRGRICMTNNQQSSDPDDELRIRTVGPLFYRIPEENALYNPDVAHVWTAAAVEVVDRRNLPRMSRGIVPSVALARPEDLRRQFAIGDILLGNSLPPPTISAVGMMIYMQPSNPQLRTAKAKTGSASVRELKLLEKVQMNLWSTGDAGLPGGEAATPETAPTKLVSDYGLGMPALFGSAVDGIAVSEKLKTKSLLMIETPGSFLYNLDKNTARFDIAPQAQAPPGGLSNIVTVTQLTATKGQNNLFCTVLNLDFSEPSGLARLPDEKSRPMALRILTATGPQVYLSLESNGLTAQGTELRYERDSIQGRSVTTLRGNPAYAKRDNSELWGGDVVNLADIIIDTRDAAPNTKDEKTTAVSVNGSGRVVFFDPEQKKITGSASWGKRMKQTTLPLQNTKLSQEKLEFDGPGRFADANGDFRLTGDKLLLWLAPTEKATGTKVDGQATNTNAKPDKLIADGNVEGGSPDMIIQKTDKLFVNFRDVAPPKVLVVAAPLVPQPPLIAPKATDPKSTPVPVIPVPEPVKDPPNPIYLSAAVIHANVVRYPTPVVTDPKTVKRPNNVVPAQPLKYQLETARCDERVVVYQNPDPKDPAKPTVGLLIKAVKLNLEQSPAGSVMKCTGDDVAIAEFHLDKISIYGPTIDINEPDNTVSVDGMGKMIMKSTADLSGNDLPKPSDIVVNWAKEMRFFGAKGRAEFLQNVSAMQIVLPDPPVKANGVAPILTPKSPSEQLPVPKDLGEPNLYTSRSTIQGHRLDLAFDRPIYFNQMQKKNTEIDPKTGLVVAAPRPKLKTAVTTPVPEDERAQFATKPARDVYFVEEVFDADNKYVRARWLRAKQIDFTNREKEQELYAAGEGELRLLNPDQGDEEAPVVATSNQQVVKKPGSPEMKLTVVQFAKQMVAKDQGKIYQEAVFDKGATAFSIPTDDLNFRFEKHALPLKSTMLSCIDSLTVSSSQTSKDVKPEQWMVANGNAEFRNDTYLGIGGRITYKKQQFIFDGTPNRMASLSKIDVGVGRSEYHQAEQLIYKRNGRIEGTKVGTGKYISGG
jgi:hypothetical protein